MNSLFWVLAILLLIVGIVFLVAPLFRGRVSLSVDYKDSNLEMYNSKVEELVLDLKEERIDKDHYDLAVKELDHELLLDVPVETTEKEEASNDVATMPRVIVASVVVLFIPVFSVLLYLQLSTGIDKESQIIAVNQSMQQQALGEQDQSQQNIELMIETLATELYKAGGTLEEWSMLGRAYKKINRYKESSAAFAEALKIQPDARLHLERAEALALLNGQSFVGEAKDEIMKALELEPNSINVLWFAGVAEFQSKHYGESIDYLIRLSAVAKEDEEIDQSIRHYISIAREHLIAGGTNVASVDELLGTTSSASAESLSNKTPIKSARLEVVVDINSNVRKKFSSDTVVFVYAKAKQGPKMPLAAQRIKLGDLPTTVFLDDSMAMMDGMNISAFPSVVVSARVSKTGSAISQQGDYIGSVDVNDVFNSNKLNVTINTQI